ncbi:hypothetical protein [Streptomyces sp. NPDC047976]|uniref:hypothetical protein n=1 Tax=Streptomyces sp. NPDC047976 TaxID=3155746 RepID=UPI003435D99E
MLERTTTVERERLWEASAPLLDAPPPVEPYAPGSWGPDGIGAVAAPYRRHLPGRRATPS